MDTRKISLIRIAAISFLLTIFWSASAYAQIIFQDGFETGDFSHTENGVAWGASNHGAPDNLQISTANPKTGAYSLEFTFAGGSSGDDAWSEQRFGLGNAFSEIWVAYDIYIPSNYYHRTDVGGNNNKFLDFWCNPYSPPSFYVNFSTEPTSSGGSILAVHWANKGVEGQILFPSTAQNFIGAQDLGKWMSIVAHIRVPTGDGTNDGVVQMWKNGNLIIDYHNMNDYGGSGQNYFDQGYILGWANSGFSQTTIFYVDNFVISDTPLDGSGGGGGNTPPPSSGSGGDSGGGSGGSGCGFVKDNNGKGQKAKGEGLIFAIMLVITLIGIALARRAKDLF